MRITVVAGARPNFMKVAPILAALRTHTEHEVLLVHTGQHYGDAMSGAFLRELDIPEPDANLQVGSGSHAEQTANIMVAFEKFCLQHCPDWVIVVGDVNSTVACAITAKKLGVKVAHVEAGLRSRDMSMPEEINRLCTDCISDLLFTTDEIAGENLRREGIPEQRIAFVGNTMIDTLLRHIGCARALPLPGGLDAGGYAVLTLHRPANVDTPAALDRILRAIEPVAELMPVAFPVHPRTAPVLDRIAIHPNFRRFSPFSYLPFLGLVANSYLVLTDSGGIQEETTVLGIPCVTLRPNTERPVTCDLGTNVLAGTDPVRIRETVCSVLRNGRRPHSIPPLWDGQAGARIARVLLDMQSKPGEGGVLDSISPAVQASGEPSAAGGAGGPAAVPDDQIRPALTRVCEQ
jgi:UDP-N-acetylglucosamine 2-epimerase (non-hydrolysing)